MKKLIVFEGDGEVIVCAPKDKKATIKEYFKEGKRLLEDYDIYKSNGPLIAKARFTVNML